MRGDPRGKDGGHRQHGQEHRTRKRARIAPNPDQPRRTFTEEALEELAASIREKGIIQPLILRVNPRDAEILREHKARPQGLADLLNWAALVGEGIVVNKDGSFLAGWSYTGPDLDAFG